MIYVFPFFMIFSRFFTAILFFTFASFFSLSLAFAGTSESINYLLDKVNIEIDRNSLLDRSLFYLYKKESPEYISEIFMLESKNKQFLFDKIFTTQTFTETSQNISFLKDIETYTQTDIWAVLELSENREKTTDEYIALGEILLESTNSQIESFSAQEKGLKQKVSSLKKKISQLKKEYKKKLTTWESGPIENLESQIKEVSRELIEKEMNYEKIKIYKKRLISSEKKLKNRLTGAKENRDALIKNVKVKGESGKFIEAIE